MKKMFRAIVWWLFSEASCSWCRTVTRRRRVPLYRIHTNGQCEECRTQMLSEANVIHRIPDEPLSDATKGRVKALQQPYWLH